MSRLNYASIAPQGFQKLLDADKYVFASSLEENLIHLVYLRVSQINGCPYCVDKHWQDATKMGVDARKLNAVIIWRDAPFFSLRERAALEWAETMTHPAAQDVIAPVYDRVKKEFDDKEMVDLTLAIATMNALNRVAIGFHSVPAA